MVSITLSFLVDLVGKNGQQRVFFFVFFFNIIDLNFIVISLLFSFFFF